MNGAVLRSLDRRLDQLLADQLRQDREAMRRDHVDEADIRWFCRSKVEQWWEMKGFVLPEICRVLAGQTVPRNQLN